MFFFAGRVGGPTVVDLFTMSSWSQSSSMGGMDLGGIGIFTKGAMFHGRVVPLAITTLMDGASVLAAAAREAAYGPAETVTVVPVVCVETSTLVWESLEDTDTGWGPVECTVVVPDTEVGVAEGAVEEGRGLPPNTGERPFRGERAPDPVAGKAVRVPDGPNPVAVGGRAPAPVKDPVGVPTATGVGASVPLA